MKWELLEQTKNIHFDGMVFFEYYWYEQNKRRDKSNIAFAKKFVEDVLIDLDVIVDDNWHYMSGFSDHFFVDSKKPRIEIVIREVS